MLYFKFPPSLCGGGLGWGWIYAFFILISILVPTSAMATPPRFSAVIFDCDGVLVDTEYLKFLSWKEALEQYQVSFMLEEYMPLVGHSSKFILSKILIDKKVNLPESEVLDKKSQIYKRLQSQGVPPIEPAITLAKKLALQKDKLPIKLALASSAPRAEIMHNLKAIGLEHAFDFIISGEDNLKDIVDKDGTNKPKPYIYQRLSQWLALKPEECLVFEDTHAGVIAAVTAGMSVIAVPNRFTLHQDFSKATKVLQSLDQFEFSLLSQRGVKSLVAN